MILHFRKHDIEIEKCDYIANNGAAIMFGSKKKSKLPFKDWHYYNPIISKRLFAKMKKEEMLEFVREDKWLKYYKFTEKAFAYEGIYK